MLNALRRTLACSQARRSYASPKSSTFFLEAKRLSNKAVPQTSATFDSEGKKRRKDASPQCTKHAKRNPLGVQLLSRQLHAQIFQNVSFPSPKPSFVQIAREHLEMHGLDPKQGPFFQTLGSHCPLYKALPLTSISTTSDCGLPSLGCPLRRTLQSLSSHQGPDYWDIRSGWTKYYFLPDGSSYSEYVEYPQHNGKPEETLVFDNAWYAWISPWLLGESSNVEHLIPLGPPGHPTFWEGTQIRFLDTMALHVAVKGISSHQRPAWMKYRKSKEEKRERRDEAVEMVVGMLQNVEAQYEREVDEERRAELCHLRSELEEGLSQLQSEDFSMDMEEESRRTWEDLTSANSLADVAKLHCNIDVDKGIREEFMRATSSDILEHIHDFLNYCAMMYSLLFFSYNGHTMTWRRKPRLKMEDAQLDWTPKVAGKSRGVIAGHQVVDSRPECKSKVMQPAWFRELVKKGPLHPSIVNRTLPLLLKMTFDGHPLRYTVKEKWHYVKDDVLLRLPTAGKKKTITILSTTHGLPNLKSGRLSASDCSMAYDISCGKDVPELAECVLALASSLADLQNYEDDPSLCQLDWSPVDGVPVSTEPIASSSGKDRQLNVLWPKWYWDLARPKKGMPPGSLDITVRNRIAPILLQLSWLGWPLFHSREHGWTFRVRKDAQFSTRLLPLDFFDRRLHFFKLPHKDGDKANVGSPLGKTFIKYAQDGTLTSPGGEANDALDMNAQCSYWISARDRILNQMVVWQDNNVDMGMKDGLTSPGPPEVGYDSPPGYHHGYGHAAGDRKTWLTASNAKKNRVGSELKAMELWISSCMGDAQFGLHGTKAAGTDLHSKTASILGISRDQAKVFNYSRIYGAGMRHAILLLLQSNASMHPDQAQKLAENLYATTKGKNTHRPDLFGRKFWYGGTESFVFNKLEEIALSDRPQTPALGCGVFGADFMTSRINWVVQSSGVDYLHLLIVAMSYLTSKYDIAAATNLGRPIPRCARTAIANLWTRSLFAFKLGMDDLPQSVAFFSAVDIDHVLRKEVDMPCVTPSHPMSIPAGESLNR
ncbi:hypothetical protein EDC04DRAFT_2677935 [Pisolithus marmoratus]|nr:hypothetical protein EDC04DRAFT_2677935 [Pisolithus marmoratus]